MPVIKEYLQQIQHFSRNAKLFLWASALRGLGFGLNQVILNLYFLQVGLSKDFIGVRISLISIAAVVFSLPGGRLSDWIGRRKTLIIASLLLAISTLVQIIFPVKSIIIIAVFFMGAANVLLMVTQNPFLAENSGPRERAHLFGISFALMTLAGVVGSLLGGSLPNLFSTLFRVELESPLAYRSTLITGTLIAATTLLPLLMMGDKQRDTAAVKEKSKKRRFKLAFSNPKIVAMFALPQLITSLGAGLIVPFFNVFYSEHLGASPGQIGMIFSWQSVVTALAILLAPVLAVRVGKIKSIVVAQLASLPFMLLMALSCNIWVVAVAAWMRTAFMNMANPVLSNFTMEVIPPEERATVNSIVNMSWNLGWAISSRVAGYVIENISYTLPFYGTIFFYGTASLLYWVFFGNYELNAKSRSVNS